MAYMYKTTNKLNGRYYIGVSGRDDSKSWYLGSGKLLKAAIKKYGKSNFEKEIIQEFDTIEEAFKMEREIVDEDFVNNPSTYNYTIGGGGSAPGKMHPNFGNRWKHSEETKKKMSISTSGSGNSQYGKKYTKEESAKLSNIMKKYYEKNDHHSKGVKLDDDHKKKISKGCKKSYSNRKELTCPHCGKTMKDMLYGRYHGDKCKMKKD